MGSIFENAARTVPNRLAFEFSGARLTFGELDRLANRTARALQQLGIARGARVVCWSDNAIDLVPLFVATARLGALFAPANGRLSAAEAQPLLACGRPDVLLTDDARWPEGARAAVDLGARALAFTELAQLAASCDDAPLGIDDVMETDAHAVFFTSGSTGLPKGVVLSHRAQFLRSHPGVLLERRGIAVSPFPMFHMAVWTTALQQWHARDGLVVLDATDAGTIARAIELHRGTRMNAVPAIWERLLDRLDADPSSDVSSLRFADTGTSATPLDLLTRMKEGLPHAQVRVFYGSTESSGATILEDADVLRKPGSCGVAAEGAELALGEGGELLVRTNLMFDGYLDDPVATDAALSADGWYRTGDVARIDDEGYVSIVGRVKEIIRTGGESVSPVEVEAVLKQHPRIEDAAVVGIPNSTWGEIVGAFVVVSDGGAPLDLDQLRSWCAERLARFKQPRVLHHVDEIPRTVSTNQVRRSDLVAVAIMRAAPNQGAPAEESAVHSVSHGESVRGPSSSGPPDRPDRDGDA